MNSDVNQKINTLLDAFDSGEDLESIVQALGDSVPEVREAAYWLLTEIKTQATEQALRRYPYSQMQLLHTIAGRSEREPHYFTINTDKKELLSNCHSEESKGYAYASMKIWNLQTGELTNTLPFTHEHMGTGQNGQIIVWHFQHIIDVRKSGGSPTLYGLIDIASLAVSDDGSIVTCGGYQRDAQELLGRICNDTNEVVLWDLEVNQKICTLPGNTSPIQSICLSSDREWVVSYDTDQTIKIYGLLDE